MKSSEAYVKEQGLDSLKRSLHSRPYPNYPTKRLFGSVDEIDIYNLPVGEWTTSAPENAPENLQLHPWLREMLENPELGVLTGKGAYWDYGPNHTVDSIIIRYDNAQEVLLIQRVDTGEWALPGGFIDHGESTIEAAVREVKEETTLDIGRLATHAVTVYEGPVTDPRATAHAWPSTTAFRFDIFNKCYVSSLEIQAGDDAATAAWVPIKEIGNMSLFGSHEQLIELALEDVY